MEHRLLTPYARVGNAKFQRSASRALIWALWYIGARANILVAETPLAPSYVVCSASFSLLVALYLQTLCACYSLYEDCSMLSAKLL